MIKVYFAARYDRRFELRPLVKALKAYGIESTAQWIDNAEESKGMMDAAIMDIDDVMRADVLVFFGQPKGSENRGGGRWFELGYAAAMGKKIIALLVNGEHESVFTALPNIHNLPQGLAPQTLANVIMSVHKGE